MRRALDLASRGRGAAFPNPMVGAVVLREGEVVGEGFHECCGSAHAESTAIRTASAPLDGATLVVNLEPCCHTGRTGPCVEEISAAGISRVFVGMRDPDPRVDGRGIEWMRRCGIEVETGLLEEDCAELNRAYIHYKATGRSLVRLKLAVSLDGRLAARDGSSRWISNPSSRAAAGRMRSEADAVMVGAGTLRADDPSLLPPCMTPGRRFRRIVASGREALPSGARLFDGAAETVVAAPRGMIPAGIPSCVEVWEIAPSERGLDLAGLLERTAAEGIGEVLCEGGSRLATSLLAGGLAERLSVFVAPVLLGGSGLPATGDLGVSCMGGAVGLEGVRTEILDGDVLVEGRVVHGAR